MISSPPADIDWKAQYDAVIRGNRFWAQVYVATLLLALTMGAGSFFLSRFQNDMKRVRASVDTSGNVRFSTLRGVVVITHLWSISPQGYRIAALLPNSRIIIDSESVEISRKEIEALDWRSEGGRQSDAPIKGAQIDALYYRPQFSDTPPPSLETAKY
ncbi:MAG: hypothetical protein WCP07_06975 [bacterium]